MLSVAAPQLRIAETTATTPILYSVQGGSGKGHLMAIPMLHGAKLAPAATHKGAAPRFHTNLAFDVNVKPNATTPPGTAYTPAQISKAYGFNQISAVNGKAIDGTGQTIAIVNAYDDPNIQLDLATFDRQYGLPALDGKNGDGTFTKVVSAQGTPQADPGWIGEISLDVEWAHALAPKANIILFEAKDVYGSDLFNMNLAALRTPGVTVISNSWGQGEGYGQLAADSRFFQTVKTHPATILASTGDNGTPAGYPSYSPNVLAVGGTSLYAADDNPVTGAAPPAPTATRWAGAAAAAARATGRTSSARIPTRAPPASDIPADRPPTSRSTRTPIRAWRSTTRPGILLLSRRGLPVRRLVADRRHQLLQPGLGVDHGPERPVAGPSPARRPWTALPDDPRAVQPVQERLRQHVPRRDLGQQRPGRPLGIRPGHGHRLAQGPPGDPGPDQPAEHRDHRHRPHQRQHPAARLIGDLSAAHSGPSGHPPSEAPGIRPGGPAPSASGRPAGAVLRRAPDVAARPRAGGGGGGDCPGKLASIAPDPPGRSPPPPRPITRPPASNATLRGPSESPPGSLSPSARPRRGTAPSHAAT